MTKTSHSKIYSTESGITGGGFFKTHPLHFTKEQLEWIENIQLPKRLFLISATEFDDRYLYLHDDWRYRFSGNNLAILFSTGKYFCDLSPVSLKLLKYLTIAYINENSASVADKFAQFVATTFKQIEVITRESLIEKMQMLVAKTERNHSDSSQFYYTLYALRKLDRNGFFESKDDSDELEDLLLEVPRPRNNNWARYQNLDLVIPEEVCLMIENGIQRWASKLCPKIDVEENKNIHLETVRKTIKIDTLRDCIIIGIVYYIGARPVQIGKLSGGDFIVDTENKYGMRYSVLVPYAKIFSAIIYICKDNFTSNDVAKILVERFSLPKTYRKAKAFSYNQIQYLVKKGLLNKVRKSGVYQYLYSITSEFNIAKENVQLIEVSQKISLQFSSATSHEHSDVNIQIRYLIEKYSSELEKVSGAKEIYEELIIAVPSRENEFRKLSLEQDKRHIKINEKINTLIGIVNKNIAIRQ